MASGDHTSASSNLAKPGQMVKPAAIKPLSWAAAWRIARRDLSARFKGLRLLLICLFLGTGSLAAIGTLTAAIESEIETRGQQILGGDMEVELWQRMVPAPALERLRTYGRLSSGLRMQAMAIAGENAAPIGLKSVDEAWPLYGQFTLKGGRIAGMPKPGEAWLAQGAMDRLDLQVGDPFSVGSRELIAGGIIEVEPDKLSEGFQLGASVIVHRDFPVEAGLTAPGALYQNKVRLAFSADNSAKESTDRGAQNTARNTTGNTEQNASENHAQTASENHSQNAAGDDAENTNAFITRNPDPKDIEEELETAFPNQGFDYRSSDRAAPGTDRFVGRMSEFLILVGLTALVIAGIGIGGGVSSFLDARRASIATLKILGATARDIERIYALQITAAALAASLIGILAALLVTPLLGAALQGLLPVSAGFIFDPTAAAIALAYGLLVAFIFSIVPLRRARHFHAMALMRARIVPLTADKISIALVVGGLVAIAALALTTSRQPLLAGGFLAGAGGVLAMLALIGVAIQWGARKIPRTISSAAQTDTVTQESSSTRAAPNKGGTTVERVGSTARHFHRFGPLLRSALANFHRPGSATLSLVTALGYGLTAFVLLAAIQTSIAGNIDKRVPNQAPDYFVLDIPRQGLADFKSLILNAQPQAQIQAVPAMRGAILAFGPADSMQRVADLEKIPDGAWALRGERGLTYSQTLPPGSILTQGQWWPADYDGPPLVSVDAEFAEAAGLNIGDRITIGILGVEKSAQIASLRGIEWENMGFNYVLVFSPNMLVDAPHNFAATVKLPPGTETGPLLRQMVQQFPSASAIEVGEVLTQARAILGQVSIASFASASIAVLAGLAVLIGAIAASRAARSYDIVVLRVLGASKRQILLGQLAEYALLCALLAGVALAVGCGAAWLVITQLFAFDWLPDWGAIIAVLLGGIMLVMLAALAGSLPLLRARPAQALRNL